MQSLAHGFPHTFQAIESLDGGQDMGRVRPLLAPGLQQPGLPKSAKHQFEQGRFSLTNQQPGTKLAEDGGIKL